MLFIEIGGFRGAISRVTFHLMKYKKHSIAAMWGLIRPLISMISILALFGAGCEETGSDGSSNFASHFMEGQTATNTETQAQNPEFAQNETESTSESEVTSTEPEPESESESEVTSESESESEVTSTEPEPEPEPEVTPEPEPEPEVVNNSNNPRYTPGEVELPAEFLKYGTITYLRFERCSIRNGLLVQRSALVYSIAPPSDDVWRQTDAEGHKDIGTQVRFADGTRLDGYVKDYHGSYPMPLLPQGQHSHAFWERDY